MKRILQSPPPLSWIVVLLPLVIAFFYTPLAFGGVTPETVRILHLLLAATFVMWIGLLAFQRRIPRMSPVCLAALLLLLSMGISYLWNPRSAHLDQTWRFIPLKEAIKWLPGSVDYASSFPVLINLGALLGGGLVLQDALANSRTRWFLFRAVAFSGFVIGFIGAIQKADGQEAMLWVTPERSGNTFFAAFRYHANAASFLNLCWPAAFAVWLRSRTREPWGIIASIDFCVFFFVMVAVFVNTSKAGHLLGLVGMGVMAWRFRAELKPSNVTVPVAVVVAMVLVAMLVVTVLPAVFSSIKNWSDLAGSGGSWRGRLLAYEACLRAIPESGFFGTGPGTFRLVFPSYSEYLGNQITGFWYHAHQDWLQGILEWGIVGFGAWFTLFLGAFVRLGRRIGRARKEDRMEISDSVSFIALGLVLIHALADFPLQIPAIQLLVVFYLALAWSVSSRHGLTETQKSPPAAGSAQS